jgi:crossover junction endodeoxyribonuclease RuvC
MTAAQLDPDVSVLGVDTSLTCTGWAAIHRDGQLHTGAINTTGRRDDTLRQRDHRAAHIADGIAQHAGACVLAVIELSTPIRQAGMLDIAGLWWRVVAHLHALNIPVVAIPAATLKKWATGKGNADKAAVSAHMSRMWPTADITSSDVADALALATIGAQSLGWDLPGVPTLARHRDALTAVRWPEPAGATP